MNNGGGEGEGREMRGNGKKNHFVFRAFVTEDHSAITAVMSSVYLSEFRLTATTDLGGAIWLPILT